MVNKAYQLIKEYEGSPKLGTIHYYSDSDFRSNHPCWKGTIFYNASPEWLEIEYNYNIIKEIHKKNYGQY